MESPTEQEIRSHLLGVMEGHPPNTTAAASPWIDDYTVAGTTDDHHAQQRLLQQNVALATAIILGALYAYRLYVAVIDERYNNNHVMRELLVATVVILGLQQFVMDIRRDCIQLAFIKIIGAVIIANIFIPCVWRTRPLRYPHDHNHQEEEEEVEEDMYP